MVRPGITIGSQGGQRRGEVSALELPGRARDSLWSRGNRALTVGLVLTIALTAFEVLAVATVMPIVVAELGGFELYGWAFSAFFLGSLLGAVMVGGLLDRGSLVGAFLGALVLFGLGLVVAGTAGSMAILVVGRFVQGLGAGALTPVANVAIGRGLPEGLRARMFAVLSTAWVLPAVLGPAAAGLIGEIFGWRVVFLGLLPLIGIAGALTWRALGAIDAGVAVAGSPGVVAGGRVTRIALALAVTVGAALVTAGLGASQPIVLGAMEIPVPAVIALSVTLGAALAGAAFRQLTPPGTLRLTPGLPAAILLRGVLTVGFFALYGYVSLALIDWRGLPAAVAGMAIAGGSLTWTLGAWVQARGAESRGHAFFVRAGFACIAAGSLGFAAALDRSVPLALAFATFGIAGFGMGLAYAPQALIVLREARADEQGAATSALSLADLLGTALGTGLTGAILAAGLRDGTATGPALLPAFLLAAATTVAGFVLSGRLEPAGRDGDRAALR
jgi:MFS family permease